MELSLNPLAFAYLYFFFSIFRQTRLACLNLFNAIFLFFFLFLILHQWELH